MAEIADAIVGLGRATLENAIKTVNSRAEWRARVVYGDTGASGAGCRCAASVGTGGARTPGRCSSLPALLRASLFGPTPGLHTLDDLPSPAHVALPTADSLFVHLPGRSRAEAFRIGREIADAITAANPPPVVLKMEKVGRSVGFRACRQPAGLP